MSTPDRAAKTGVRFPDGQAVVLYDGTCPLCLRSIRILKRLDWLNRVEMRDCRDLDNLPHCENPLGPVRLLAQMHLVTPDRKQFYAGFSAVRWMAWRVPATVLVAPLLPVPGVGWVGDRAYRWVARNRFNLLPCTDRACTLRRRDEI